MSEVRSRFAGFTLVELLVAMAVLGILISAIIALTSGFLGFSRRVSVINDRLVDLNDAMGYIGLTARSSMSTFGGGTPVDLTVDGAPVTCSVGSADGPCVAFLTPVVDRTQNDSPVTGYRLLAYRILALSDWAANPGIAPGWDGTDTPILVEHRADVACGASCVTVPNITAAVAIGSTALVLSDLFLEPGDVPMALGASDDDFTLTLRVAGAGQLADVVVPSDGPLSLTTRRRP